MSMLQTASFLDGPTAERLATLLRNAYGIITEVRLSSTRIGMAPKWCVYIDGDDATYFRASAMAQGFMCALDPEA